MRLRPGRCTAHSAAKEASQIMTAILETVDPAAAIGTIDEILNRIEGRVEKARRRWNLTTARGFAQAVLAIALGLRGGEKKQVAKWRPSFSRAIRKNWPGLTPSEREAALTEVDGLVQTLGTQVVASQNVVLDSFAEKVFSDARVSAIRRYGLDIAPSFSRIDFKAMESTVDLNVNFIRDREGAIADAYSVEARDIVSDGISKGLGRKDISKNLASRFGDMRKPSYWDFISSHYVATGRTDSFLTSYSDAGVARYKFSAVLDERTSDQCRAFDGRTFSVADTQAMLARARAAAEEDPNAIKEYNPFVHATADEDGAILQARQPGGQTTQVARIERSGVGAVGDRGDFTKTLSSSDMLAKGIGPPPLHEWCRSTIVPLLT